MPSQQRFWSQTCRQFCIACFLLGGLWLAGAPTTQAAGMKSDASHLQPMIAQQYTRLRLFDVFDELSDSPQKRLMLEPSFPAAYRKETAAYISRAFNQQFIRRFATAAGPSFDITTAEAAAVVRKLFPALKTSSAHEYLQTQKAFYDENKFVYTEDLFTEPASYGPWSTLFLRYLSSPTRINSKDALRFFHANLADKWIQEFLKKHPAIQKLAQETSETAELGWYPPEVPVTIAASPLACVWPTKPIPLYISIPDRVSVEADIASTIMNGLASTKLFEVTVEVDASRQKETTSRLQIVSSKKFRAEFRDQRRYEMLPLSTESLYGIVNMRSKLQSLSGLDRQLHTVLLGPEWTHATQFWKAMNKIPRFRDYLALNRAFDESLKSVKSNQYNLLLYAAKQHDLNLQRLQHASAGFRVFPILSEDVLADIEALSPDFKFRDGRVVSELVAIIDRAWLVSLGSAAQDAFILALLEARAKF